MAQKRSMGVRHAAEGILRATTHGITAWPAVPSATRAVGLARRTYLSSAIAQSIGRGANRASLWRSCVHIRRPGACTQYAAALYARALREKSSEAGQHAPLNDDGQATRSQGIGTTQLSPNILLRCTVLDSHGTIKTISGVFRKSELCSHHGLEPRDLRKIDSRVPNLVPTILARQAGVLINILHIRALVKADAVLLFDSYETTDSRIRSAFVYNLEHNLRQASSSLPYEFRALESILASVLDALRSELNWLRLVVSDLLEVLEDDIDREKLRMLLQISRKLNGFLSRSRGVKNAVTEVLESDEDMALMYLSDAQSGKARTEKNNLSELELLLESFEKQVEEVVAEIEQIYANVNNTQEIVELILDSNRNRLLALDLRTSIITLGVSAATLFVGLFGMNLTSHLEDNPYAFYAMSAVAYVMALAVVAYGLRRLAQLRRIGLSVGGAASQMLGSGQKLDPHLMSHAQAWWWRENQFRALRRQQQKEGPAPTHDPWGYDSLLGMPPRADGTDTPRSNSAGVTSKPLDASELNAGQPQKDKGKT